MTKKELKLQQALGIIPKKARFMFCEPCNKTTLHLPTGLYIAMTNKMIMGCWECNNTILKTLAKKRGYEWPDRNV